MNHRQAKKIEIENCLKESESRFNMKQLLLNCFFNFCISCGGPSVDYFYLFLCHKFLGGGLAEPGASYSFLRGLLQNPILIQ